MQGISLWLLILSAATGLVFLATVGRRSGLGAVGLQAGLGLSVGLLGAMIALVLQIDLIPDEWDPLALTMGPLAFVIVLLLIRYQRTR